MTPALSIRDLRKTYPNGVEAVVGIDLEVAEGDFFALLGPNGAGKSTTIGIVTSLVKATAGRVEVFGRDIDRHWREARRDIGLVPQEFNFNVWEPVEEILWNQAGYYGLARDRARERTEHYLRRLGLWHKRRQMARNLSGGMKRRLMVARSLVHEPRLLILDEPTAGVDIEIRRSTWEFLREINARGTTIILTTHYLEEAEHLCRNVAIIDHGRIVERSAIDDLLRRLRLETFILDVAQPVPGDFALEAYPARVVAPRTLEVDVEQGQGLNGMFQALTARGVQVESLRTKSNRLEELFLHLVAGKGG
jgi:ABC-2 type transport system ATP-binding protein